MASRYRKVTAAFDGETHVLFEALRTRMGASQSDALRQMVRACAESPLPEDPRQKRRVQLYRNLLDGGEHLILDIDRLSAILRAVGTPTPELRDALRAVARSHADQWRNHPPSPGELLERLEACNFFKVSPGSPGPDNQSQFTLLPASDSLRHFVKWVVADLLEALGYQAEIREDLAKLRVRVVASNPMA